MKLSLHVHPNSKKPRVEKSEQGTLHVYVSQPPAEGRANEAVKKALADYFDTAKSNIKLVRGQKSKVKVFEILH